MSDLVERLRARAATKAIAERALRGTPDGDVLAMEVEDLHAAAVSICELIETVRHLQAKGEDDIGYLLVDTIVAHTARDSTEAMHLHDAFREFYKPEKWFGSHRAAASFLAVQWLKDRREAADALERAERERDRWKGIVRTARNQSGKWGEQARWQLPDPDWRPKTEEELAKLRAGDEPKPHVLSQAQGEEERTDSNG